MENNYSLNIAHLKKEFLKDSIVIAADPEYKTKGAMHRKYRQSYIGDLLIATGHTVEWGTGKATYTRK